MDDKIYDITDNEVVRAIKNCWENDIFIYPKPINTSKNPEVRIVIRMGGTEKQGGMTYTQKKVYDRILQLYMHYDGRLKNKT